MKKEKSIMGVTEKAAYLKGLVEGSDLKLGDKEKKIMDALLDTIGELAQAVTETNADIDNLYDGYDSICESLDGIEEDLDTLFDDGDFDSSDEEFYDVECPNCGEKICIDESTLLEGDTLCPNCGEKLEFDLDCDCDCEECAGEHEPEEKKSAGKKKK